MIRVEMHNEEELKTEWIACAVKPSNAYFDEELVFTVEDRFNM